MLATVLPDAELRNILRSFPVDALFVRNLPVTGFLIALTLIAVAFFCALRRVRTSYPPPVYRIGVDFGRDTFAMTLLQLRMEERIALSVINPKSFVLITGVCP